MDLDVVRKHLQEYKELSDRIETLKSESDIDILKEIKDIKDIKKYLEEIKKYEEKIISLELEEENKELLKELARLQKEYPSLLDIKENKEYEHEIEKEITLLKEKIEILLEDDDKDSELLSEKLKETKNKLLDLMKIKDDLYLAWYIIERLQVNSLIDVNNVELELKEIKNQKEELLKKRDILYEILEIQEKLSELENIIIKSCVQFSTKKKELNYSQLLSEAQDDQELEIYLDVVCNYMYKAPLLVALLTRDPSQIATDILSDLNPEDKNKALRIIEQKKREIENNLVLSDKVLIDLIEHVSGKNITRQQTHNEKIPTGFNRRFDGQVLTEDLNSDEYILLHNQTRYFGTKSNSTIPFRNRNGDFIRTDRTMLARDYVTPSLEEMLARNYPTTSLEDILRQSFNSLPSEISKYIIGIVISNLELCYKMYQSFYSNISKPAMVYLSNGEMMDYRFDPSNIPHILGIPKAIDLPQRTLRTLSLRVNDNALTVLEKIIYDKKMEIIENQGLVYDTATGKKYEMLPWEKIILKTNAFIRGDFFHATSLIVSINPNSFLPGDVRRISITPTRFNTSAINQVMPNSNFSVDENLDALRKTNQTSDFIFKGMTPNFTQESWIPKTNLSAIGERIMPKNARTLQTLEKYRYLLSNVSPNSGGFVVGGTYCADYSIDALLKAFVNIASSFGNVGAIEANLRDCLEQIRQMDYDKHNGGPKK